MALFCVAIRRDSVYLWRFPFLIMRDFICLSLELSIHFFFFLFLFPSYCWSVDACVVCVFSGHCYLSLLFLCSLRDVLSIYRRYLQRWHVLFLLLFLKHIVTRYHLGDVRVYTLLGVFLFSAPFVDVLPLSTLKMISSILRGGQPRCLSLWWDFCNQV